MTSRIPSSSLPITPPKSAFDISSPATSLPPPPQHHPGVSPSTPKEMVIPRGYNNEGRIAILSSIKNSLVETGSFIKKHPLLALCMTLGICLIACAFPSLASSLVAHFPGITILHANLTLGFGFGVIILYYGIYLIDIARKPNRQEFIKKINEQEKKIKEGIKEAVAGSISKVKITVTEQANEAKSKAEAELAALGSKIENLSNQLQAMKTKKNDVLVKFNEQKPRLEEALSPSLKPLLAQFTKKLDYSPEIISPSSFPVAPFLLNDEITIPTQGLTENKVKLVRIKDALIGIGQWMIANPSSTLIMTLGILITLVAVPALVLFLKGFASMDVIGTLSIYVVLQLAIYGISLMYQGYEHAAITRLSEMLDQMQNEYAKRLLDYQKPLENQSAEFQSLFQKLRQYDLDLQEVVKERRSLYDKHVSLLSEESLSLEKVQHAFSLLLLSLTSEISQIHVDPKDIQKLLNAPARGAELLS